MKYATASGFLTAKPTQLAGIIATQQNYVNQYSNLYRLYSARLTMLRGRTSGTVVAKPLLNQPIRAVSGY